MKRGVILSSDKTVITKEIVQQFKEGDEQAFQTLYEYFYKKIYFYALYVLKDNQLAEDAVQNTFLNAYQQRTNLLYVEAFHVWIMRIASGECKKMIRKKGPETTMETEILDQYITETEDYGFIEEIVHKEVDTFPTELRSVAILKYFEEFKETEISEILDIPLGTVKSRLIRVRKKLQKGLQEQEITPKTYRASSITIPVVLAGLYNGWFESLQMNPTGTEEVVKTIMKAAPVASGITISAIGGTVLKITAATGIIASSLFMVHQLTKNPEEPEKTVDRGHVEIVYPAEIEEILFDDGYTNQPIEITVVLSNENYDYYTINAQQTDQVTENGDYLVELYFEDEVVDSETFSISNIDRNEPKLVNHSYSPEKLATLNVLEAESAIASVVIYRDGTIWNNFSTNSTKTQIQFTVEPLVYYEVHVTDLANNVLKIRVYEKNE